MRRKYDAKYRLKVRREGRNRQSDPSYWDGLSRLTESAHIPEFTTTPIAAPMTLNNSEDLPLVISVNKYSQLSASAEDIPECTERLL